MNAFVRAMIGLTLAASGTLAVGAVSGSPDDSTTDGAVVTTEVEETTEATPSPKATPSGRAFATAKQAWVRCVQGAHALHREDAKARRAAGEPATRFDRNATCGAKPHPRGFGLGSADADADTPKSNDHKGKGRKAG